MGKNSIRNRKVAEEAERYLEKTSLDLLGPAGRILRKHPPTLMKSEVSAKMRVIDGHRSKRKTESQPALLGTVSGD